MRKLLARMTGWVAATDGSRAIAAAVRRGPVMWLFLCGALLAAAILVGTAVMIGQFRERALANGERELENTVLLLTRHFDQQFEDSNIISRNIIAQMGIPQIASPEEFRQKMSGAETRQLLRARVGALSYIGDVNIFDVNGRLINSSAPGRCRKSTFPTAPISPRCGPVRPSRRCSPNPCAATSPADGPRSSPIA